MYIIALILLFLICSYFILIFIFGSYAEINSYRKKRKIQKYREKLWHLHKLKMSNQDDFAIHHKLILDNIFLENKIDSINEVRKKLKILLNQTEKQVNETLMDVIKSGLISSKFHNEGENAKVWVKGPKYNEVNFFFPNYKSFVQKICLENGYDIDYNTSKEQILFRGHIFEKTSDTKVGQFIYERAHSNKFALNISEKACVATAEFYQTISINLNKQFIERTNLVKILGDKMEKDEWFENYSLYKKFLIKPVDKSSSDHETFFFDLLNGTLYNHLKLSEHVYYKNMI